MESFLRAFSALLLILSILRAEHSIEKVKVQLNWTPQFEFAGIYMAKELGLYAKEGMEVEVIPGLHNAQNQLIRKLENGDIDFGISYGGILIHSTRIKILGALFAHSPLVMVVKGEHKRSLSILKKIPLYCNPNEFSQSAVGLLLADRIDSSHVHSFDWKAFEKQKIAAIDVYVGNKNYYQIIHSKEPYTIIDPATYGYDFYTDFIVTSEKAWRRNPLKARKFAMATLEGWRYALTHIDKTVEILKKRYIPNADPKLLYFEARQYLNYVGEADDSLGLIEKKRLEAMVDRFIERNHALKIDIEKAVDPLFWQHWGFISYKERWWMARHRLSYSETHWPPFFIKIEKDKPLKGIIPDYLARIEARTGLLLNYRPYDRWQEVLDAVKQGHLDMAAATGVTKERESYAVFTHPYASYLYGLAMREGESDIDLEENSIPLVAVGEGYTAHQFLKQRYPQIKLRIVADTAEGLRLLKSGEVDAVVDILPTLKYQVGALHLSGIKILTPFKEEFVLRGMIRKGLPEAVEIFNKGIATISDRERQMINNRWMPVEVHVNQYRWLRIPVAVLALMLLFGSLLIYRMLKEMARRKRAEETLKRMWNIIDRYVLMSKTDLDGNITYVSNAFAELTGYSKDELIGQNHRILKDPAIPESVFEQMWKTIESGRDWSIKEIRNIKKDGSYYWIEPHISPIFDEKGNIIEYMAVRKDITPYKQMERLASIDPMTGFYNRRAFTLFMRDRIARLRREGGELLFALLDVDHFKAYNDLYGHGAGDEVLIRCTAALHNAFKRETDLFFRMGGEEFAIVMEGVKTIAIARELGAKIVKTVADLKIPHKGNPPAGIVTISVGMVLCHIKKGSSMQIRQIYSIADRLMYKVKKEGRNGFAAEERWGSECIE